MSFCGNDDTQVKDSRSTEDNSAIRRRRFCAACGARFTTFERIQLRELTVLKKNGKKFHLIEISWRDPFIFHLENVPLKAIELKE